MMFCKTCDAVLCENCRCPFQGFWLAAVDMLGAGIWRGRVEIVVDDKFCAEIRFANGKTLLAKVDPDKNRIAKIDGHTVETGSIACGRAGVHIYWSGMWPRSRPWTRPPEREASEDREREKPKVKPEEERLRRRLREQETTRRSSASAPPRSALAPSPPGAGRDLAQAEIQRLRTSAETAQAEIQRLRAVIDGGPLPSLDENAPLGDVDASNEEKRIRRVHYEVLADATANFSASRIIGRGGFGAVYKGVWGAREVAIKRCDVSTARAVAEYRASSRRCHSVSISTSCPCSATQTGRCASCTPS